MNISLQHNGIYCKDINESIKFYEEVLGFEHLFSTEAIEGDKPLKMAWIKNKDGVIIELLEQFDKKHIDMTAGALNHIALRVDDMDAMVNLLNEHGIAIEAGPFDAEVSFDRDVEGKVDEIFKAYGPKGLKVRIMFFRGPGNERFEAMQDNIGPL